jgi:hypothetical protein
MLTGRAACWRRRRFAPLSITIAWRRDRLGSLAATAEPAVSPKTKVQSRWRALGMPRSGHACRRSAAEANGLRSPG